MNKKIIIPIISSFLILGLLVNINKNETKNDTYIYTYMYKFGIELPKEAQTLILPKDDNIAVFAITLSDNYLDDVSAANEMRALPLETKK